MINNKNEDEDEDVIFIDWKQYQEEEEDTIDILKNSDTLIQNKPPTPADIDLQLELATKTIKMISTQLESFTGYTKPDIPSIEELLYTIILDLKNLSKLSTEQTEKKKQITTLILETAKCIEKLKKEAITQCFSKRLMSLQLEYNEAPTDLADYLFIRPQNISDYLNGKQIPDISRLMSIAEHYNCSIDYLVDGTCENKNKISGNLTANLNSLNTLRDNNTQEYKKIARTLDALLGAYINNKVYAPENSETQYTQTPCDALSAIAEYFDPVPSVPSYTISKKDITQLEELLSKAKTLEEAKQASSKFTEHIMKNNSVNNFHSTHMRNISEKLRNLAQIVKEQSNNKR